MIDPELTDDNPSLVPGRTLREFAGICLAILAALCAISWYRQGPAPGVAGWTIRGLLLLVGLMGLIRPGMIAPLFLAAMAITKPIGHVVGVALLALVYYGVITPLAVWFRWMGRDGLHRSRSNTESYWVDHLPSNPVRYYVRQYQLQTASGPASQASQKRSSLARNTQPAPILSAAYQEPEVTTGAKHE